MLLTLQQLQMEYREGAPAIANRLDRYATRIEDRIGQLRQLTSNFLKFVNVEEPNLVEANLTELVERFAAELRRSLPPDIQLTLKSQSGLPMVRIDPEQIHALLDNLTANAINAMPDGGVITISTSLTHAPGDDSNTHMMLELLDTGAGMDPDVASRIFEPGFTTAEEGSGLGLAIVKKIVDDHDRIVTVESELGTGSVFSVCLPLVKHSPAAESPSSAPPWSDQPVARVDGET